MNTMPVLWFVLFFWLGAVVNIAACASSQTEKSQLSEAEERLIRQYEAELDLGRTMAGKLLQYYKVYDNTAANEYVNLVGQLVAKNSPFSDRQFTFGVLDTDALNAFATPGGYILITRGALKKVENEAELAGILGHEIAHVGRKHIYDAILKKTDEERLKNQANIPSSVVSRQRPEAQSSETTDTVAKYIGGSAGGQFNVLTAIRGGISVLFEEGIDPKLENEADLDGIRFAFAAGYEPRAMAEYFERILKQKEKLDLKVLNKTHPSIDSRIRNIKNLISASVPKDYAGAIGKERFAARTRGI